MASLTRAYRANIIRTSTSGNEWTSNELDAYNIRFAFLDAQTFFEETPLPAPGTQMTQATMQPIASSLISLSS